MSVKRDGSRGAACCLLAFALLGAASGIAISAAQAQQAERQFSFDIPEKPVSQAVNDIARIASLSVVFRENRPITARSNPVRGTMTASQALSQLLSGTGLSWSFTDSNTITITGRVAAAFDTGGPDDGSLVLDVINVSGGGGESSVYTPYETAAATSHISSERIERFRGSSPSDIFRGTPGVLSGDSRNSAGGIDINVRGLQGMGRVRVTVDDAENAVTSYLGYQGQSNKTYVDPDFIAGIDVNKGGDVASRGMAGTVAMRTISASDIIKDEDSWGVRVKGGFGTNTSSPTHGATGGYSWPTSIGQDPVASSYGLDRPSFLSPRSGSASIAAAVKGERWDFLAGYAYRKQGNYHAGKRGGEGVSAEPVLVTVRNPDGSYRDTWRNAGFTNYRPGEEVMNTSLETKSFLAKGNVRFGENDEHHLQFNYNNYRSEGGYLLPILGAMTTPEQNRFGAKQGAKLDTGTVRYRWNPDENDLVDLKVSGWLTYFQMMNDPRLFLNTGQIFPIEIGLPENYRTGTNTLMWGAEVTNRSQLFFDDWGDLDLTYGASYLGQDVRFGRYAEFMSFFRPSRGEREEASGFAKAAYKPVDWLTLNAGLRYSHYWSNGPVNEDTGIDPSRDDGGWSPSLGITLEPWNGVQFYANYGNTQRLPSIVESVGLFTVVEPDLRPERLRSVDIGVNLNRDGIFNDSDRGMLKFGWFDWNVKDYISRATEHDEEGNSLLRIHNIHGAKFSGLELSGRYENGGFTAELAANYYTNVEYCLTAEACGKMSLYGDYATNHVPPEYTIDLTLSQKLLDDRLTIGGRAYHVGPRAADHGDVTAQGYSQFITQVRWKPYTLFDVFAEYKINDSMTASFRVENLTDEFYVDPLGLIPQPGPGRTFYASLTGSFGGDQALPQWSSAFRGENGDAAIDWSGVYAGFHGSFAQAKASGTTSVLDQAADTFGGRAAGFAASESANLDFSGGQVGLQVGYNHQFKNHFVLGVEADWSKSWVSGTQDNRALDDEIVMEAGRLQSRTHHDIDWTGSLRGRLGYAFNNGFMMYGTAGLTGLKERVTRDQYVTMNRSVAEPAGKEERVTWADMAESTRVGLTAGLGGEYALNERWSIKGEYNYSRFGSKTYEFASARAGGTSGYTERVLVGYTPTEQPIYRDVYHEGGYDIVNGRSASNSLDLHTIKIGLNYRF